ncbi:glutamyl-tRNA reductase [Streptomyces sp. NPDC059835]|uniref:glutamyl-tRNA reductase n=1 Tax=Streptomyces sp. NPDC059835 TaxID=3346967 RepID=UPI00366449E8
MSLLVVGLSHRSAPVSVLERASLSADAKVKLLHDTLAAEPAAEATVLATCNRIELYADVDKFHAGVAELSTLLAQHSGVALEELTPYLYVHYEDRAVHHLFSVACGLDSMVVGEGQILGQIKDALALGQEQHTAGRLINDLFQQALRVGKRAHSETGIDRAGQSLVTFGLEQLAVHVPVGEWAAGKRALVIGAGSMSSLAAATLARVGVAEVVVANRTAERAERLAEILVASGTGVAARSLPMAAVADELTRVDVVVSCTGATGLVLTADDVLAAVSRAGLDVADAAGAVRVTERGSAPDPGGGDSGRGGGGGGRGERGGVGGGGPAGGGGRAAGDGDAAMGLRVAEVRLVNCGAQPYVLEGYPRLSLRDDGNQPVEVAVEHGAAGITTGVPNVDAPPERLTLAPGQAASVAMVWRNLVTDFSAPAVSGRTVEIEPRSGAPLLSLRLARPVDLGNTGKLGLGPWRAVAP